MEISRRAIARIVSFSLAIIAALTISATRNAWEARELRQTLDYTYLRAVSDLSTNVDNIKNTLSKGMYAGSPEMLQSLSNQLWTEANSAKSYLSTLPVSELNLENTYKFLSQVGDYAQSLAKKAGRGEALTEEEQENLAKLQEYCQSLCDDMWELEGQVANGFITFDQTVQALQQEGNAENLTVASGFQDFEESFTDYPTLIYDGPYSDHILEREPLLIKGAEQVDRETARKKALAATGLESINDEGDEEGRMPSYDFKSDGVNVSVTKAGGLVSYMIKSREVLESNLSAEEAQEKAREYLDKMGVGEMVDTYYEIVNNVMTINFAGLQEDVTLYTDLIKISVALDNGEILGFDARGYIVNHHEREINPPKMSIEEAREKVSSVLSIQNEKLALIPSNGQNEVYAYEFTCVDNSGQQVLVYINADTGFEEQILILLITQDGVLTI